MASDHPFQNLFETLGRVPTAHAESVNRQASGILSDILTVPLEKAGRCILLRAPRAGHGKTHLLSRIQHRLAATNEFIPLHAASGFKIDAVTVTEDILRRLVRQLPAAGGLTVLDLLARRLFATALEPLVSSGEVPSEDRVGALAALRNRPVETFDFHHPYAVTAHWAKANFAQLSQRLSYELSQRCGQPVREIDFWVGVLFRYCSSDLDSPNRVRTLTESLHPGTGSEMERLEALLGLLTLQVRVVLIADDLEGFSTDETAALRFAAFLGALRQSVERVDIILSLNQDIWQSAFIPRLSDGLADRLSEVVVELEPLTEAEMVALLESRAPGLGNQLLGSIDRGKSGTHPRGLIRAAGLAWLKATAADSTPVSPASSLKTPFPAKNPTVPPALPEAATAIPIIAPTFEAVPAPAVKGFQCPPPLPPAEKEAPSIATTTISPPAATAVESRTTTGTTPASPDSPFKVAAEKPAPSPYEPPPGWVPPKRQPIFLAQQAEVIAPVFEPEPAAAASTPAATPFFQAAQPVFQAVHEEPSAPQFTPEAAVAFSPAKESASRPTPSADPSLAFQLPPDSPFEIISTDETPAQENRSTPVNPSPAGGDNDRVDDLLRQFRERYSRGSL